MSFIYDQSPDVQQEIRTADFVGKAINEAVRAVAKSAKGSGNLPAGKRVANRRKSIRPWMSRVRVVDGETTQAGFVANYDNFAVIFEFGSINSQPYRPLTNAVQAAGLQFEDSGPGGDQEIELSAGGNQ